MIIYPLMTASNHFPTQERQMQIPMVTLKEGYSDKIDKDWDDTASLEGDRDDNETNSASEISDMDEIESNWDIDHENEREKVVTSFQSMATSTPLPLSSTDQIRSNPFTKRAD